MATTTANEFESKCSGEISKKMYLNTDTADVRFLFESDGENRTGVPAHRNVLASGSPVFHAMFYGEMKEKGSTVTIVDASRDGFRDFLSIFYHDKVVITRANVAEFINLSNKYDVPEGLEICQKFLLKETNLDECCIDLSLAVKFNLNALRKQCENRIRENADRVLKTKGFISSSREIFKSILGLGDLHCTADDIFNASIAWAENVAGSTDGKVLRDELGECLHLIPFRTMSIDVFSKILLANATFFAVDDITDILDLILTGGKSGTSSRFSENCRLHTILKFRWDEDSLIMCTRGKFDSSSGQNELTSLRLYSHQYTTFSSSKRMLLGGFRFFVFQSPKTSQKVLSANITVTKKIGGIVELLHDIINFKVWPNHVTDQPLEVILAKPVVIIPDFKYDFHVDFSSNELQKDGWVNDWVYVGMNFSPSLSSVVIKGDTCISFHKHPNFQLGSDYSIIADFYFNQL